MGEEFLNRLYKDMYKSEDVMHGIDQKYIGKKEENIKAYLDRMEYMHNQALEHNHMIALKEFYYRKYVIKEENIPSSYYKLKDKISFEKGKGHINFDETKIKELNNELIRNQKESLDLWLDYLLSDDANYPFWAKYWAFKGMLTMGNFNKETGEYEKRSKSTTNMFADLNREALAITIDHMIKFLNGIKVSDEILNKLLENGSFKKIYSYVLKNINKKELNKTDNGIWKKYSQGSDYSILQKDIVGKGTGWCTAGGSFAEYQLGVGDFYIYYSYDKNGMPTIPRIAIRTDCNHIVEVRGIAQNQNLEPNMEQIVLKKLSEFTDKEKYIKKIFDMKKITELYGKDNYSDEELAFLYEIGYKIDGFGYSKDPRIKEILETRDKKNDLAHLFKTTKANIGLSEEELNDNTIYYEGNLIFNGLPNIKMPKIFKGNLIIMNLSSAVNLKLPKQFYGNLFLNDLKEAQNLILPPIFKGDLYLDGLEDPTFLNLPSIFFGNISLKSIKKVDNFNLPTVFNGSINLSNLTDSKNLKLPTTLNGNLNLNSIEKDVELELPKTINGDVYLNNLKTIRKMTFPETMNGNLYLNSLTDCNNLVLPKSIHGSLYLNNLQNIKELVLPEKVDNIYLYSVNDLDKTYLPIEFSKIYLNNGAIIAKEERILK